MASPLDKKTSQLPTAGSLAGLEYLYGIQGGVSKKFPVALFGGVAGGAAVGVDEQTINAAGTTITDPAVGKIKLVNLNVAANTTYTGLPAPTGSGFIYVLKQKQAFNAAFSVAIDGTTSGDPVLFGAGESIGVVDLGTYQKIF